MTLPGAAEMGGKPPLDDIEAAVAGKILAPGLGRGPALLGLWCSVEHGEANAQ
jgi:hypothetical protein